MSVGFKTKYAPNVFKALDGVVNLYKPLSISGTQFISLIRERITDDLNQLQVRPVSSRVVITGKHGSKKKLVEQPNWADHPAVVGPRYVPWELPVFSSYSKKLSPKTSGVEPMLIGSDAIRRYKSSMREASFINVYNINAKFGFATNSHFDDGSIIDKTTYKHIKDYTLNRILDRISSDQRNRLFDAAAVPWHSDQAYLLAKSWPSKPAKAARWPVIYSLKCIEFNLPDFVIEVTVNNENEKFLAHLINDIGLLLRSSACVKSIRRVQCGPFKFKDSLTDQEWDLQSLINNIYDNKKYLSDLRPSTYSNVIEASAIS